MCECVVHRTFVSGKHGGNGGERGGEGHALESAEVLSHVHHLVSLQSYHRDLGGKRGEVYVD